jgi:hypothetical protein
MEQDPCVACGSSNIHRSRPRNLYERVKKLYTPSRPFHCHDCGWRGWLQPLQSPGTASVVSEAAPDLDLTALDAVLAAHRRPPDCSEEVPR